MTLDDRDSMTIHENEDETEAERKAFIRDYVSCNAEYYASSASCVHKACELWEALQEAGC